MKYNKTFLLLLLSLILMFAFGSVYAQGGSSSDSNGSRSAGVTDAAITTEYTIAYSMEGETFIITNSKEIDTVNVTAEKIWDDANNQDALRPSSISFQLLGNGDPVGTPVSVSPDTSGKWAANWINLPKNNNGRAITYTVDEVQVPDGYTSMPSQDGLTVTNSHTPETNKIKVIVTWDDEDNNDGIRPTEALVGVTKPDGTVEYVHVDIDDDYTGEIELPKYTPGKVGVIAEYSYLLNAPTGYYTNPVGPTAATIVEVVGIHEPEKIDVIVNMQWQDQNNRDGLRPEDVDLTLSNGVDDPVVSQIDGEGNDWTYTFAKQYKYRNGELVTFTLESENLTPNYTTTIDKDSAYQFTVTQVHEILESERTVVVEWQDQNNRDGLRPNAVTVTVRLGNDDVTEVVVDKDHSYTTTLKLPQYVEGQQGQIAEYTYVFKDLIDDYVGTSFGPSSANLATLYAAYIPERVNVDVKVVWDDDNNRDGVRPSISNVTIGNSDGDEFNHAVTGTGNEWSYTFEDLYEYATSSDPTTDAVKNVFTAAQQDLGDEYTTTIEKVGDTSFVITNKHTPKTSIKTVNVVWEDDNNRDGLRQESVTVDVKLGNDIVKQVVVNKGDDYSNTAELPVYVEGKNGVVAEYTYVFNDLRSEYSGQNFGPSSADTATLIASYSTEDISIDVDVVWVDDSNQDGYRPDSVDVTVTDSDNNSSTKEFAGSGNTWSGTFSGFKKNAAGNGDEAIANVFNAVQSAVGDKYTTTVEKISDTKFVITNTHISEEKQKTVNVTWDDDNDRDGIRPDSVLVDVKRGNETVAQVTVNKSDGYSTNVTLPVYAPGKEGVPAEYTYVFNNLRSEYEGTGFGPSSADVATLNAAYSPANTEIKVTVKWDDANNQDRLRPDSVDVTVSDTDGISDTKSVNAVNNSTDLMFTGFKEYASTSVDEEAVLNAFTASQSDAGSAYTTTVEKVDDHTFIITNTHKPSTTSRTVTVIWDDDDNRDGIRPETLTPAVVANGAQSGDKCTIDENKNWQCTFDELDENAAGNPINYRVQILESVSGYTYEVSEDGWTITYTHKPASSSFNATLVWVDNNNNDGVRPDAVTLELYANDAPTGKTQTVSDNNQTVSWSDLLKNENGQEIVYTVRQVEDLSENYLTEYDDNATRTIVTNTHDAEMKSLYYEIVWDDESDQDGYRPANVTIVITGDNGSTRNVVVSAEEDTISDSVDDLAAKKNGEVILYSAAMPTVPAKYELDVMQKTDGKGTYVFTLTHIPEKTHLFTIVEWDDEDNIDGIRPEDCNVCLRKATVRRGLLGAANGDYDGAGALESANVPIYGSYAYDFRQLEKKSDGELIQYEVYLCDGVPEGYTLSPESDSTHIILVHEPEKEPGDRISKTVRKEWDDNDDFYEARPAYVTVRLYGDGQLVGDPVDLTEDNYGRWAYTFTDLPTYNSYGNKIDYVVREDYVSSYGQPHYTTDGLTIVNTINENTQYDDPVKRVDVKKSASNSEKKCVLNDTIEIRLWVQNTGKTGLHNVTVRDYMLDNFEYLKGSLTISNEDPSDTVTEVTENGEVVRIDANIDYLPVNAQRVITYKIRVADPSKVTAEPALFDYGNDEPLSESDPDPKHWSNRVAPCIPDKTPDVVPVVREEVLPKTGFAPNVVTVLPEMNIRYSTYNSLRLRIPSLGVDAEIYGVPAAENGSYDVTWLGENVGWLQDTAMPGSSEAGNTVITGHLTNNYGLPGVFSNLQYMKYGDKIIIEAWGSTYTYTVDEILTVYADTPQILSQRTNKPELSLLTCKYYNAETGLYDGRVVVKAKLEAID